MATGLLTVGLAAVAVPAAQAAPIESTSGYIVALRAGGPATLANRFTGRVEHTYDGAFDGFSARLTRSEAARLAADPGVAYVVADTPVRALGEQPNPPSWGLDRIDQRRLPLDALYRFANTAPNVTAYVIDTGVRATHADFGGRVRGGIDLVDDDGNPDDGNGHGTFIAGIIGGSRFGVAKEITITPVRVLNNAGSGTMADVIAGVNWVAANARKPAVANMSLGGAANAALDTAVRNAIASGVTFVVAAGSSASDAGNFSPARVREAITTAATRMDDCVFPPSNFGPLIDLYAPGERITSTWATSDTATNTISGTSFSTPHVVGGAALILSTRPAATPAQVASTLITRSTMGVLCNVRPNTANRLLYTGP
ncbi:MAG TPA: S8 family peptidase [Actinophytocola sp.]|uniref:S8 family peptidase n=1 Tax=Actinophytocola sp. TaxID=1872138 RepID=UPI002DB6658C|nr:S8 family peptidase [Actinophytocola sp.]HEU5469028.1 S8 family peptidase [Actinophytocola sp.]